MTALDEAVDAVDVLQARVRRNARITIFLIGLVVAALVALVVLLAAQQEDEAEDQGQTTTITRLVDRSPCSEPRLRDEDCRRYLNRLADKSVMSIEFTCFIVQRAGLIAPACATPEARRRAALEAAEAIARGEDPSAIPLPLPGSSSSGSTSPPGSGSTSPPSGGTSGPPAPPSGGTAGGLLEDPCSLAPQICGPTPDLGSPLP